MLLKGGVATPSTPPLDPPLNYPTPIPDKQSFIFENNIEKGEGGGVKIVFESRVTD